MSAYVGLAIAAVGGLLQSTILHHLGFSGVHIDIVLLSVIVWGALRRWSEGLTWALFGGLSLDLLTAGPFGAATAGILVAATVGNAIGRHLRPTHPFFTVVAIPFAVTAFYGIGAAFSWQSGAESLGPLSANVIFPAIVVNSVVGVPLMVPLIWLDRLLTRSIWGTT
ncbi:MAG: rod shape-determining protein MreD [Chloroflexota bacterium]|nr:MAG: rod shape-determining protein MreD [Chloroflexota bacterium]